MTKALILTEMSKGQHNTKMSPKSSITQRLRIDLGQSDGVTTVIQLVRLNDPASCLDNKRLNPVHTILYQSRPIWLPKIT